VAVCDELGEGVGLEVIEAGPEGDVGVAGNLGLEADEVLKDFGDGEGVAAKEELALEEGAVEGAAGEEVPGGLAGGHGGRGRRGGRVRG
jgi:hypothetical protein